MTAPGWYNADGDPPGTTRYWDGEMWVGDPVSTPAATSGGFVDTGTPGGSASALRLASAGARIGARLIDIVIAIVIGLIVFIPVLTQFLDDLDRLGPNPSNSEIETILTNALDANAASLVIFTLVGLLWDFVWVGVFGGTPGKLILGLRVARADNGATPPGWGKAALRSLNRLLSFIPGIGQFIALLVGLASLIMLFVDDQHRTVMDRVATTVVIKK